MTINFYCREAKVNKKGLAHIQLCINIDKRIFINLPIQMKPCDFDRDMCMKKNNNTKDYCDNIRRKVDDIVREMELNNIPLTSDNLKEIWENGGLHKIYTLGDMWNDWLAVKGQDSIKMETYVRYEWARDKFYEHTHFKKTDPAKSVTQKDILILKSAVYKEYCEDAAGNYMSRIKGAFKLAFESGKIPATPFSGVKIARGTAHNTGANIKYLTLEQLDTIRDKKFASDRLRKVADCFLFACFTGLSFIDLKELTPDDFQTAANGLIYIKKNRRKTGVEFTAVLMNDAIDIAKKYNFQLPVLSNQKYNEYLKEIATLCNIPINLTTHIARHTAATYLINKKVDYPTLMKIFGWSNTKMIQRYAKLLDDTVFETIADINEEQKIEDFKRLTVRIN